MKIAVITPYINESTDILSRCHDSVMNQTYLNVSHIMVADGHPSAWTGGKRIEHITLPISHHDAGATPRALGALSAFSRGYDAVAFLDADNWYQPEHIKIMVDKMTSDNLDAVVATRNIFSLDGKFMYTDTIESNIANTVDTNCWLLSKKTFKFMPAWITDPANHLISDMVFCKVLKANKVSMAETGKSTVNYTSNWGWHYEQLKLPIPIDAVWLARDSQGNHIKITEKEKRELK